MEFRRVLFRSDAPARPGAPPLERHGGAHHRGAARDRRLDLPIERFGDPAAGVIGEHEPPADRAAGAVRRCASTIPARDEAGSAAGIRPPRNPRTAATARAETMNLIDNANQWLRLWSKIGRTSCRDRGCQYV